MRQRTPFPSTLIFLILTVAAGLPARAAVSASPSAVSLLPTETSSPITLTVTHRAVTFTDRGTLAVLLPGPLAGNVSVLPSPVTYGVSPGATAATTTVRIATTAATPPGTWTITFRDRTLGAGAGSLTLTVRPPGIAPRVVPAMVTLTAGGAPVPITLITGADPGFTEPVLYSFEGLPPGLSGGEPQTAAPPAYAPLLVSLGASETAPPGLYDARIRARTGGRLRDTLPLTVRVLPPAPVLEQVFPSRLVSGARGQRLRLLGRSFEQGARLEVRPSEVQVEDVRILSSSLAEVTLSALPSRQARPVEITLVNPSGARTPRPGRVTVLPADSLAAPLSVLGVSVVHPRPGGLVGQGEELFPRGLVAVSGSGPVSGAWLLDGVPYDRFVVQAVAGRPVAVASRIPLPDQGLGAHDLVLRIESPQEILSPAVPVVQVRRRASALTLLAPEDGALLGDSARLSWSLVPGAVASRLEIEAGPQAHQRLSLRTAEAHSVLRRATALRLTSEAGVRSLRWRVSPIFPGGQVGSPSPWRSLVVDDPGAASGRSAPAFSAPRHPPQRQLLRLASLQGEPLMVRGTEAEAAEQEADEREPLAWATELEVSVTGEDGDDSEDPAEAGLTASAQLAREASSTGGASGKLTLEGSFRWFLEGEEDDGQEDESWLGQLRLGAGRTGADLQAGYGSPRFQEGATLLDAGLARGGGEVRGELPLPVSLSLYRSFDPEVGEATSGLLEEDQEIAGAALELGSPESRARIAFLGLETERQEGLLSPGEEGRLVGAHGRFEASGSLAFEVEAGRGRREPGPGSLDPEQEGEAYRLGIEGILGETTFEVDLRRVGSGFVNPVSLGYGEAGPADRDSLRLEIGRTLGKTDLEVELSHEEGGDAFGPGGQVQRGEVRLSGRSSEGRFAFSAAAGLTATEAEGDDELFLEETDTEEPSLRLALEQTFGSLQLRQEASYTLHRDAIDPVADTDTLELGLSASGSVREGFQLNVNVVGTRLESDPFFGTTESLTAFLQPTWRIEPLHLRASPSLSYTTTRNEVLELDDETEQARLVLGWEPPWLESFFSLEASAEWSRSDSLALATGAETERRYSATATFRWGREGTVQRQRRSLADLSLPRPPLPRSTATVWTL